MKMRKLLATAVAATMAVTSLATVASAAEKSFDMGQTTGTVKFTATTGKEVNFLADENGLAPAELGISADDVIAINVANATKKVNGVSLKVVGIKGSKANSPKTYTYAFGNYASDTTFDWTTQKYDGSGSTWALQAYATTGALDAFVPSQFVEITQISIVIDCESSVTSVTAYDAYGSTNWGENIDGLKIIPFQNATWTDILMAINNSLNAWGTDTVDSTGVYAAYSEKSTSIVYPFLPKTGDDTLTRDEIRELSSADDYDATGRDGVDNDDDQSYNGDDTTAGTNPVNFAGLASQVADFFNKQTNGTITFTFTAPAAAAGGSNWVTGGIPSTQTGVKNVMGSMSTNDIALFFNYDKTGSLQAVTSLDTAAASVTFDISDVLDALGGQTMGVLDDIYYGLNKGITYDGVGTGLYVEKVTLAYADDADVEADIEDDAEIEDDTTVEEDDDVALEDDADEEIVEDDADDEATDGDVIVETEDDDANPGTGVALAVVPALVAAAAVVVSKKRS